MSHYDAIVLGTGGVGSAALYHLAQRGLSVLGLDRFTGAHDRGSSHGHTRVIRKAYFEHPDYVPLLIEAYRLWKALQQVTGQSLYVPAGLLNVGPAEGNIVQGIRASAAEHDLPLEQLTAEEVAKRWPGYTVPEGYTALFEEEAGFLMVERAVQAHLDQARLAGATCLTDQVVLDWSVSGSTVTVRTESDTFEADRLVITAGSWTMDLLGDLEFSLQVLRKPLHWYRVPPDCYQCSQGAPTFFYDTPAGYFYGFPAIDGRGLKVARHTGGQLVADPLQVDRSLDTEEQVQVAAFLGKFLPEVTGEPTDHAACLYTMSADEHFIVDRHPEHDQVVFAAGLSGHGFKFATVLGKILSDLVADGTTTLPVGFLGHDRPGLRAD
jgi:sarcosine oxidase